MNTPEFLRGDSPTRLLQGAAVGALATMLIGFMWGGWSLASTTQKQVAAAEQASVVRVLAPICADKFARATDAKANLEALNKEDSWKRDAMIVKAGWATFPGSEPDRSVAAACLGMINAPPK